MLTGQFLALMLHAGAAGFYQDQPFFAHFHMQTKVICGVSGHLVCRDGEPLELRMELWVAPWGSGELGLRYAPPAAKKTQTCDSNYGLYKESSLHKEQRERAREPEARLKQNVTFLPSTDVPP